MVELFANSGDPDQTPHSAASDLALQCLPVTRLGVSSLQRVKMTAPIFFTTSRDRCKGYKFPGAFSGFIFKASP